MKHRLAVMTGLAAAALLAAGTVQAQCPGGNCPRTGAYPAFYAWTGWGGYTYNPRRAEVKPEAPSGDARAEAAPEEKQAEPPAEPELRPFCARVIELVNASRRSAGLPELEADGNLCTGCDAHSAFMRSWGFAHGNSGGPECIAFGAVSPESVVNLWMGSAGHRAILLGRGTRIGVGRSGTYWTLRVR